MAVQLVLHSDEQSLHSGFFLGSPCDDMTGTAKTARAAAALRPVALALETIALNGCWMKQALLRAGIMEPGQRAVWASTSEKSPLAEREKKRERGTGGVPSAG